jgi:hypothetical protein
VDAISSRWVIRPDSGRAASPLDCILLREEQTRRHEEKVLREDLLSGLALLMLAPPESFSFNALVEIRNGPEFQKRNTSIKKLALRGVGFKNEQKMNFSFAHWSHSSL